MTISPAYMTINQIKSAIEKKKEIDPNFLCTRIEEALSRSEDAVRLNLTLQDYAFIPSKGQKELVTEFSLEKKFEDLESRLSFTDRVNNTALAILARIRLYYISMEDRFKIELERTGIWAALIDSATFCEVGVRDLDRYGFAIEVMATRLDVLSKTEPGLYNQYAQKSKNFLSTLSNLFRTVDFPIGQLRHLTGAELSGIATKLNKQTFSLVSDEQMPDLDFSKLSGEQIQAAIEGNGLDETCARRIQKLTPSQVHHTFLKSADAAEKMPPELYQSCPLSKMKREVISRLFCSESMKSRFQKVPVREIMDAIPKIDNSFFVNLSIDQIRSLDLSRVGSDKMDYIFDYVRDNEETNREKVGAIPLAQVRANAKYLQRSQLRMLTLEQIQVLDLSTLPSEKIDEVFDHILDNDDVKRSKVQAISIEQIKANSRYLRKAQLEMLSNEQRHALNFSALSDEQLASIVTEKAIGDFDSSQLNYVLKHIYSSQMTLIPADKLAGLNFTKLRKEQIVALFPGFTPETMYPGHTHTMIGTDHVFEEVRDHGRSYSRMRQDEYDAKVEKNKKICRRNLASITPAQFGIIRSVLSPEVIALYNQI